MMQSPQNIPSLGVSLIPIAVLVAVLSLVVYVFGADALSGASQIALLAAAAVCAGISMSVYKTPWERLENAIMENVRSIGSAIIVLLLIGAISGSWMVSGIVPTMICYGLQIMHPKLFLVSACLICAVVSIMTGSSWTTIATIGVALIGIGNAQGFSAGWTAGAIISGAYFGDKISPLSDTTVLAASSTGTPLFTHIRYMMITTVPSFVIALAVFCAASVMHDADSTERIREFSEALHSRFVISPWLMAVPLLTGFLIVLRLPALITLFVSAASAVVFAIVFQGPLIAEIAGAPEIDFISGFKGAMITLYGATAPDTGNESLNALVATGGMAGMLDTIWLIICAVTFGAMLAGSRMLESITGLFIRFISRTVSLVAATVASGIFCNLCTGDQYLSIILPGNLFGPLYRERGYESRLLSRSIEDSSTVTSVLIPWNSCGMTQSTVLKVPTAVYFPYCIFNLISPLMSIFIAAVGYKIYRSAFAVSTAKE